MKSLYYIAIEGPMSWENKFMKLIAEKLGARLVLEEFEENPFFLSFIKILRDMHFKLNYFFFYKDTDSNMNLDKLICFKIWSLQIICLSKIDYLPR